MYALLCWVILGAATSNRLNAAIHRQPLRVDILNQEPIEAACAHSGVSWEHYCSPGSCGLAENLAQKGD